jgi:phage shock protein A
MANIFARLFKIGQSETHALVERLENPIKMTEQGIRDLKKDLEKSIRSLAEVKALGIQMKRELEEKKSLAEEYERKAMLLLQKSQKGELDSNTADRLAGEALIKKEAATSRALELTKELQSHNQMTAQLESKVKELKSQIAKWENQLTLLKARAKTAQATRKINKQLASIDSSSTVNMLEKMKIKVQEEEALAASYGELAMIDKSVDEEINAALKGEEKIKASTQLAQLKAKMGIK